MANWTTDSKMCVLLGDGWCDDMNISEGYGTEADCIRYVKIANKWLEEGKHNMRVTDCRAHDDDEMEWVVVLR